MENLTLERLVAETQEALCQTDASNYYKNVFKTLTKQFLLYAHDRGIDSFTMDFGIQFLEEHYSMSEKIAQGKWCAAYTRSMNALSEYQLFGTVSLYLATDKRTYSFPDGFRSSAEAYLSYRKKIGISNKSNRISSLYLERFFDFLIQKNIVKLEKLSIRDVFSFLFWHLWNGMPNQR